MTIARFLAVSTILLFAAGQANAAGLRAAPAAPPPPPAASQTIKSNSGPVGDEYCKNGSSKHVPCDKYFKAYCTKVLGGTMSDKQGWGGQTCFEPS